MDATTPYDATDYAGLARRHWWLVVLTVAAAVLGTALLLQMMGKEYVSTTAVFVHPVHGQDVNVAGGRTTGEINLDTEAQLVRSTAVAATAAHLLHTTMTPAELVDHVSVSVPSNTAVLNILFEAGTPAQAQAGSHAFAQAYLGNRDGSAKSAITTETSALTTKLTQLGAQLGRVDAALVQSPGGSAAHSNQQAIHNSLANQINALSGRLNALVTTTTMAGKIISDASLPAGPSRPDVPLYLGSGAVLGLLLGVLLAVVREKLDRRVRTGRDVLRADVPVLAEMSSRARPRLGDLDLPGSAGGRAFNRLRNEVVAALRSQDRVIVVAGTSAGPAGTLVAANFAAALARAGGEVILVGAAMSTVDGTGTELSGVFGVRGRPGLLDVLTGTADLGRTVQEVPRSPGLRVLVAGEAPNASGVIRPDAVRAVLDELSTGYDHVVVAAPSTATSADAQSLAAIADASLLVVEIGNSRNGDVADAAQQLRRVGATLLGAVVLAHARRPLGRMRRDGARAGPTAGPMAGPTAGPMAGPTAGPMAGRNHRGAARVPSSPAPVTQEAADDTQVLPAGAGKGPAGPRPGGA
jgi:Mrp family chromosome partitioning ATPase/capsular polysaccharide biosynthesis protein